jgi:hypothetical protein
MQEAERVLDEAMASGNPNRIMSALAQYSAAEETEYVATLRARNLPKKQIAGMLMQWQQDERAEYVNLVSNIAASTHENRMAIIRNMGR